MKRLRDVIAKLMALGILSLMGGCSKDAEITVGTKVLDQQHIAARIDGQEVSVEALDKELQLVLYDIAEMEYKLRLNKLHEMIAKTAKDAQEIEVMLPVPEPPRIDLDYGGRAVRGNPEAPITIAVFCSFQSPHCKSFQPTLRRLLSDYSGWVRQVNFDFPLKFHREGIKAAVSAKCAGEHNIFWEYHDALYAKTPNLGEKSYSQTASSLLIDDKQFKTCIGDMNYKEVVLGDQEIALGLGLTNVPVVFINGLYLKGARSFEQYSYWIEKELIRLDIDPQQKYTWKQQKDTENQLPVTDLPLALVGVSESSIENKSKALIEVNGQKAQNFSLGQSVLKDVFLKRLKGHYAVIDNQGSLERLLLQGEEGNIIPLTLSHQHDEELRKRIEQPQGEKGKKLIEPAGVLTLGQEWLAKQLEQREFLQAKFIEAELEVEGHHLMRLEGVANNEFFTALGFEENDVLLRVNDSWVHSGQNELWSALTSGKVIDVAFMRKGLPHRLQYVVEESGYFDEDLGK
ncbi:thioredoxin domain-containing protein [Microbulbifer sp. TRSA001]|uniref:thioredoxin domain-containing protein n=1 Tax=Microbulbifer sp. TRSA001 TaxID=3243381 RepID=UPI00403A5A3B